jgi:hypothetical protein
VRYQDFDADLRRMGVVVKLLPLNTTQVQVRLPALSSVHYQLCHRHHNQ